MKVRNARERPARNEPACYYYRCDAEALNCRQPTCQSVRGDIPDEALTRFAVEALNRESIDLALAVREYVVAEFAATVMRATPPGLDAMTPSSRIRRQKRSTPQASSRLQTHLYTVRSCRECHWKVARPPRRS